mmetsp:Transcript_4427/g.7340  ORF Transcript_4427/g.7340 Transcript_4427/m.7340 type:complete len:306 (-) Transcript_4427:957-1874(-)|eukprot:CAMPEP_0119104764 /NCGR_PEP_ID=MMETSP1180-20130426/2897_1 /TAXON_ID=3052 ORGANISM="Chlamydomonas cf sp, Strain CCMP681" /NCGR_SAMPLE_ID=MMETSP1180 /ASSEMBLY_ACC=CAM_ASM_000741 /LENGTH=305 /DNA_ID=CAMNT_0007089599 /DNA_START=130 /DNA_END=1047 /DNA_ORIENTATION=+
MPQEPTGPNDLFGVFSEPSALFTGEPFSKNGYELSRHKGKNFVAPITPSGKNSDALIDKTTKLTSRGDVYLDPYLVNKALSTPSATIHPKAFVPVGGTKNPSGAGSMYGVFGAAAELLDTDASQAKGGKPTSAADKKRNIYCSPARRGTYGFPIQDRTIGGTHYDFIPDEYCRGRILEKDMKKEARAKFGKAFVSTGRTGQGIVPILPAPTHGPDRRLDSRSGSAPIAGRKPWKASNPPPTGPSGVLAPIKYIACPSVETKAKSGSATKAFKPVGGGHSRLSMWAPNPFAYKARDPPDNSLSLLG